MINRYYLGVAGALVICNMVITGYFWIGEPEVSRNGASTDTVFSKNQVEGPLQPLPEIVSIDYRWAALGKALFHSDLLSKDNSISCASCHLVDYGGDDGFPVSTGISSQIGSRNSPTILNSAFNFRQFWDGRSNTLSSQVGEPIHNPVEMGSNWQEVLEKLNDDRSFRNMFRAINPDGVTQEAVVRAIVTYEESLITPNAPIDKYLKGDINALTRQQKRGLEKFNQFGCVACHQGVNIGGNLFQKVGRIDKNPASLSDDLGRYMITGNNDDKYVFKVPSLRNVADTAPYFHNGSVKTLSEAVQVMASIQLGRDLTDEDTQDLVALLKAFSAPVKRIN